MGAVLESRQSYPPKQGWAAYSRAQVAEAQVFDGLLRDLMACLPAKDLTTAKGGRPKVADSTLAWCAVKKAFMGKSQRRTQGWILDAEQEGYIDRAPRYNAVGDFLNREDVGDLLRSLVRLSAQPLAGVEHDLAVDSTGFATGTYGSYRETRYDGINEAVKRRKWVKLHAISGVHSNVVADCVVLGGYSADSPQFIDLVRGAADSGFVINEVSADKAYSGKANLHVVKELGGEAMIPFKGGKIAPSSGSANTFRNAPGHPGSGKTWRRAYHYFCLHEEEFYSRYHKRSNVEATFGAIKRRFGERLLSKSEAAQRNEVYCKVIAWNLCVLVQAFESIMEAGGRGLSFAPSSAAP